MADGRELSRVDGVENGDEVSIGVVDMDGVGVCSNGVGTGDEGGIGVRCICAGINGWECAGGIAVGRDTGGSINRDENR